MRCFNCHKLSFAPICKECQELLLKPKMLKKEVGNLEVYSFFEYYHIANIVKSKYTQAGRGVYRYLSKEYFLPFLSEYANNIEDDKLYLIGIDDSVTRGYSNVANLLRYASKHKKIKPLYGVLRAKNRVKYAGKGLEYRLDNPKEFRYSGKKSIDAILIDDTVTTGTTLEQAHRVLRANNVNVHFALTLSQAKEGEDY